MSPAEGHCSHAGTAQLRAGGAGRDAPLLLPILRDANAKVRFSVGNNFGAHSRKTIGTDAVRDARRKWIAAHPLPLRFVPRANAAESQPIRRGAPKGDGVENEPG